MIFQDLSRLRHRIFIRDGCSLVSFLPIAVCMAQPATVCHGCSMMRPMILEFPQEVGVKDLDMQYMPGVVVQTELEVKNTDKGVV